MGHGGFNTRRTTGYKALAVWSGAVGSGAFPAFDVQFIVLRCGTMLCALEDELLPLQALDAEPV